VTQQRRPGAYYIPGLGLVEFPSSGSEAEDLHLLATEVTGDRERRLEQIVYSLERDRDMLERILHNVTAAHAVAEIELRKKHTVQL